MFTQGRKLHGKLPKGRARSAPNVRTIKTGGFEDVTYLNMSYGDPAELLNAFPRVDAAASNHGVSRQTIRRARSLVAKSSLLVQEKRIKEACEEQTTGVRAVKVGWDETSIRLFCGLEQAQRLLPQMDFKEADASQRSERKGGSQGLAKPSFRLQVMQQHVCAKVGEVTAPVQVPAKLAKSTAAEDLYSACSALDVLNVIKKDAPDDEGAFADSLESNKNAVTKCAMDNSDTLVANGVCMGCR